MQLQPALFSNSALASNTLTWQTSCVTEKIFSLMHQLSDCCTSNPLLQSVVLRVNCYRVLHFPILPPARINQLVCRQIIWRNRSTHVVLLLTHFYSVLCLVMICFPSFLIIRGWTGNTEYFRVRIPDIEGFLDLLPGNKFIHHCNDGITRVNC